MKKLAQPQQLARSISVPVTQCWLLASLLLLPWWLPTPCDFMNSRIGPLYKVITIAPATVIPVPTIFATSCLFFTFTLSNL